MCAPHAMRTALIIVMSAAAAGCGASAASGRPTTPARASAAPARTEVERLRAERDAQAERAAELESLLAMSQSEARTLRAELAQAEHADRGRTIRIGAASATHDEPAIEQPPEVDREPPREATGARPMLRLYGPAPLEPLAMPFALGATPGGSSLPASTAASRTGASVPTSVPAPPLGAFDRLPVVPVGEGALPTVADITAAAPAGVSVAPPLPTASDTALAATVAEYRRALELVHARRYDEAAAALGQFLTRYPDHAYSDNALFWRGEAFYALRDYARAATEFAAVVSRFPGGNKVADALLKIGLCRARMGDRTGAHAYFQRVQRDFPGTDAARIALREDAS